MNDLTITQTIYLELKFDTPDYPTRTIDILKNTLSYKYWSIVDMALAYLSI